MNRRDFLTTTASLPLLAIFPDRNEVEALLHPHKLYLPGAVWSSLAFVGQITHRFVYYDGYVPGREARRLAISLNEEWQELPKWFSLCLGVENDPIAEQWLLGTGWERRVRIAEAYFRNGGFKIESTSDDVWLSRRDR